MSQDTVEERKKQRQELRKKRQRIVRMQRALLAVLLAGLVGLLAAVLLHRRGEAALHETEDMLQESMGESGNILETEGGEQAVRATPSSAAQREQDVRSSREPEEEERNDDSEQPDGRNEAFGEMPETPEELLAEQEKEAVLEQYENLGIADVEDILNIRESSIETSRIVGRLTAGDGCEILDVEGEWSHIRSGSVEGYVRSQYLLTGEAAKERALSDMRRIAVVTGDQVNIRSMPSAENGTRVGQGSRGTVYEVISEEDGWIQVEGGYLSADYVEIRYGLEEAVSF